MAITKNQVVSMSYEVRLNDEVIDSNIDKEPIRFIYGTGEIIKGLEKVSLIWNLVKQKI